ncbi:hypothetical protein HOT31_gp134 [Microbacterium phage Hendrix]|uniref:Uncharacterized protein n=1 Tax=Microbacterium phage Hendrix TaxID=2182341 RepID=A0A2U8UUF4_9CAUD|nr:hypothetical protein HOT31_gp134 [Microbacterium phage Hendrix]AWN07804.1 hypothetical protein PBI_HENDRIX_133 [Microbacterium phage Hendrix]
MTDYLLDGVIAIEGRASEDGRVLENGGLTWTVPIPIRLFGTEQPIPVGSIVEIERDGDMIRARGVISVEVLDENYTGLAATLDGVQVAAGAEFSVMSGRLREVVIVHRDNRVWPEAEATFTAFGEEPEGAS